MDWQISERLEVSIHLGDCKEDTDCLQYRICLYPIGDTSLMIDQRL